MRLEGTSIRSLTQAVLVPVTIGLVLASSFLLARAADHSALAYCATAAVALLAIKTKLNPLVLLAGAGVLGAAGVL
jgi:chromate transporter